MSLVLQGVSKLYHGEPALLDVSLEVPKGQTCALIGPSGSGKSTLLKVVNRMVEPSAGKIYVDGVDNQSLPPEQLRRSIGYVIQEIGLFQHRTLAENVATVPKLLGWPKAKIRSRVDELLALVGLEPSRYRSLYPRQVSGGQQQRVGVARALAADPPLLLMDEPFGALDPPTRERLGDELLKIQAELKKTVLLVTHDLDEALRLADSIAVIGAGRLRQVAPPAELLRYPADDFVRGFLGPERGMKALGFVSLGQKFSDKPPLLADTDSPERVAWVLAEGGAERAFVADHSGKLIGYVDSEDLQAGPPWSSHHDPAEVAVSEGASLREVLAATVRTGMRGLAVINPGGQVLGWVRPKDLTNALEELA